MKRIMHGMGHGRLMLPIIMLVAGFFIPALRTPVGAPVSSELWMCLVVSLVTLMVWVITEFLVMTSRNTSVVGLQLDSLGSAGLTISVSMIFGFYVGCELAGIAAYRLEWWLIVPWIGCAIDAGLSSWLAINNAAQKPFSPPDRNHQ